MKISLALFLTILAFSNAAELPHNLKPCRKSDPQYSKCLNTVVSSFIKALAPGLKSFKIPRLEPLAVNSIKIGENSGPVSLKQEYHNIKLHGLTKGLVLQDYGMDFNKLLLHSESTNPQVDFVADYEVGGQVLVLPIHGKGRSNITMVNLRAINNIYCENYVKDGKTYLRAKKYEIKFHPERVVMNFENLFDGNKQLGDQMNKFINENSDLVFKELQASYEESFGLLFARIANEVFSRIPMEKLFPE